MRPKWSAQPQGRGSFAASGDEAEPQEAENHHRPGGGLGNGCDILRVEIFNAELGQISVGEAEDEELVRIVDQCAIS